MIKTEQQINFSYEFLIKHRKIIDKTYQRLRSTGSQQARFSELAKKHKTDTSLITIILIPISSFENWNRFLAPCFSKLQDADIETNTVDVKKNFKVSSS